MNEPIIDPWLIYAIGQADGIVSVLRGLGIFGVGFLLVAGVLCTPLKVKEGIPLRYTLLPALLVSFVLLFAGFLGTLIPNSKTITAVIISQHVTPANLEKGVELTDALKDEIKRDIIEIINATEEE